VSPCLRTSVLSNRCRSGGGRSRPVLPCMAQSSKNGDRPDSRYLGEYRSLPRRINGVVGRTKLPGGWWRVLTAADGCHRCRHGCRRFRTRVFLTASSVAARLCCRPAILTLKCQRLASSSRSQVLAGTASAAAHLAWDMPIVDVCWRLLLAVVIVTHLVTQC